MKTDPPLGKKVKVGGTLKGDKKKVTVKKEVRTQASKDFESKCYNKDGSRKRGVPGCSWADEKGTKAPSETKIIETEKEIQGDDVDYDTTLMQSNQGTILEPYERARLTRNTKQTNRDVRRSKIKLARNKRKLARMEKRGKTSGSRYDRLTAKKQENKSELAVNKTAAANQALAVASGGKQGDKYQKEDTIVTRGQRGDKQLADAKQAAIRKKRKDDKAATDKANKVAKDEVKDQEAKANNITTSEQGLGVAEPVPANVNLSGGFGDPLDLYASTDYSSPFQKRQGYSMKAKSPATKKLQGAQNTLPQHLQDSIKAAPGKARTALKKGYFKNK
jgi:cation transport regulator ChaB